MVLEIVLIGVHTLGFDSMEDFVYFLSLYFFSSEYDHIDHHQLIKNKVTDGTNRLQPHHDHL